jgi:tetratricopeptide (TPR) repeat protein
MISAIAGTNRPSSQGPRSAEEFFSSAEAHRKAGRYEEAITDLNEAILLKPGYAEAFYQRGVAHHNLADQNGDYREAIEDYTNAIQAKPEYAEAFYQRGVAHHNFADQNGDYRKAIEDYTNAIQAKPGYAEAFYQRGVAKANLGRYEAAIEDIEGALAIEPRNKYALDQKGYVLFQFGKYAEAKQCFEQSLDIDPQFSRALQGLGLIALAEGQQEAAEKIFQKVSQQYNENKTISLYGKLSLHVDKGRALASLNLFDQAGESFQAALRLKSHYQPALVALEQIAQLEKQNATLLGKQERLVKEKGISKVSEPDYFNEELEEPESEGPATLTEEEERLYEEIDLEARLRFAEEGAHDDDTVSLSVASSQFASTDPKEISQKLIKRIQEVTPNVGINIKPGRSIKLELDLEDGELRNNALRATLEQLYTSKQLTQQGDTLTIAWSSLAAIQVRRFHKLYLIHKNAQLQVRQAHGLSPEEQAFQNLLGNIAEHIRVNGLVPPKCFISYAWEDRSTPKGEEANAKLQRWLLRLQGDLQKLGVTVYLDITDMDGDVKIYMREGIRESDHILVIGVFCISHRKGSFQTLGSPAAYGDFG